MDQVLDYTSGISARNIAGKFHFHLVGAYSVTVHSRGGFTQLGLYKADRTGKRRGVSLPLSVWRVLGGLEEEINLAVDFVEQSVGALVNHGLSGGSREAATHTSDIGQNDKEMLQEVIVEVCPP
ncbi:MAG: hypothetical protein V3T76_09815 [candidate division NC10 bacterium]